MTRPVGNYGLPNHLRVSIGLEKENARFLEALERVLPQIGEDLAQGSAVTVEDGIIRKRPLPIE